LTMTAAGLVASALFVAVAVRRLDLLPLATV
jgi:hypothetical protein